jgi:hypothetical protein
MTETRQTNGFFGGNNTILIDDMDIYSHRLIFSYEFSQSDKANPF